jgi:type II secretory pathway component PulM
MRVDRQSIRAVRWRTRSPRVALLILSAVLSAVGIRTLVTDPQAAPGRPAAASHHQDRAVEAFAQGFARAFLTWDAADPERHERAVQRYVSADLDPGAGLAVPQGGRSEVLGVDVADVRRHRRGTVVTVAAVWPSAH